MAERNSIRPTHRCKVCGAYWRYWNNNTCSLTSENCGKCCDNVEMGDQIIKLTDYDKNDKPI